MYLFSKVNFEDDSRGKYLELLGYKREDLGKKVNSLHYAPVLWVSVYRVLTGILRSVSRHLIAAIQSFQCETPLRLEPLLIQPLSEMVCHTPSCLLRCVTVAWQREGGGDWFMGRRTLSGQLSSSSLARLMP